MKQSPSVRAFKNELMNYRFYQSREKKLNSLIEYCYHMLGGVRSPSLEMPTHARRSPDTEYRIRDEIERHRENLASTQSKIRDIETILGLMEDEMREVVLRIYADGEKTEAVARKRYISARGLHYQINKSIQRAIVTHYTQL